MNSFMKNRKAEAQIELDISLIDNDLIISVNYPAQAMGQKERKKISKKLVSSICLEFIETLNTYTRNNVHQTDAHDRLTFYGKKLSDIVFIPNQLNKIIGSGIQYMLIKMDEELVHIPWELMYFEEAFLCEHFYIGRKIKTNREVPYHKKQLNNPLNMLIVADPESNLFSASQEGLELCKLSDKQLPGVISAVFEGDIKFRELWYQIEDYEIFHFAGHAEYHKTNPEKCGLRLTDSLLSASEIEQLSQQKRMPCLVFSNACQSARSLEQNWNNTSNSSFDLANAFIFSGVNHYVGTFWEILDEPSNTFALEFYRYLFTGKSIGESAGLARKKIKEKYGFQSISWASYLIYGDPTISYFDENEPVSIIDNVAAEKKNKLRSPYPENLNLTKTISLLSIVFIFFLMVRFISPPYTTRYDNEIEEKAASIQQKKIEETRNKVNSLYRNYKTTGMSDNWTSNTLYIVIDVDSTISKLNKNRETIILSSIEGEILAKTHFTPLERRALLQILNEKEITAAMKNYVSKLKEAHFFLFFSVEKEQALINFWSSILITRLVDDQGIVLHAFLTRISKMKSVSSQLPIVIKPMIDKIIEIQKKIQPRGIILSINENDNNTVTINIGEEHGVRGKQRYKIIEKPSIILEVYKSGTIDSILKPMEPQTEIQEGWRVEKIISDINPRS